MPHLYYLGNSRSEEQTERMVMLEAARVCIFCPDSFGRDDVDRPLRTVGSWNVFENRWPYAGTAVHLLISPQRHITGIDELTDLELHAYGEVLRWFRVRYRPTAYGHFWRNGDNAYTGGTIGHLHGHLTTSDPSSDAVVRAKLSSRPTTSQ